MLKWENGEAGSWVGRADGFEYRTIVDFFDSECSQQKAELQARHDARIAALAAANGYVKLEPGQVVVDAAEVGDALDALCDTCAGECSMCGVKDVLSTIKEARDE